MAYSLIRLSQPVMLLVRALTLILLMVTTARAELNLDRVSVAHLDNGLTLLVLEDHSAPVASVQMAYRVGGRNDPAGRMGLAHFFEHMAFRSSANFPDTGLVSEIYAVGGEWHGYTWIDQTTYFATVPREHLDLLLRIEADRLGRLDILETAVEVEKQAVLTEMNQYGNDVATRLFDAVLATHFQAHTYRNNTIGYEADVQAISHADLVDFYRDYINPGNAVLVVVGDVETRSVQDRVAALFGAFSGNGGNTLPPANEPADPAAKTITLSARADEPASFRIAYPAPAASSPDFPVFLVLQELIGGGSGANFRQSDWGTTVRDDEPLAAVATQVTTWLMPTAEPYVFLVSGIANDDSDWQPVAGKVQKALDRWSSEPVSADALFDAKVAVQRALRFNIETTEDAAHQLAFFESIGALDALLSLDSDVAAVNVKDIARVAERYFREHQRTVGWALPDDRPSTHRSGAAGTLTAASSRTGAIPSPAAPTAGEPLLSEDGRIAVEYSPSSPTLALAALIPGRWSCASCSSDAPAPGYTMLTLRGLTGELDTLLSRARAELAKASAREASDPALITDPVLRLRQQLNSAFAVPAAPTTAQPAFLAIAGDVTAPDAIKAAAQAFTLTAAVPSVTVAVPDADLEIHLPVVKPQAALGYLVAAPPRESRDSLTWELALYLFSHGYEGRFGKEAISNRGLAYRIAADYRGGRDAGLVTLAAGVDPAAQAALAELLRIELTRLIDEPPGAAELAEAKAHLIGRRASAALSPGERVQRLAGDWASHRLMTSQDYIDAVNAVTLAQLRAILPAFTAGRIVAITVNTP